MISKEMIARINELPRKQRSIGLTEEERSEQLSLRTAYLQNVREQVTEMLEAIDIVDQPPTHKVSGIEIKLDSRPLLN